MSDDKIFVKDLSGMEKYGSALTNFATVVETAGDESQRQFEVKGEGTESQAYYNFLNYLNELQNKVFDQFPATIKEYGTGVGTFASAVRSTGFSSKAKTSDSGITSVASKLDTQKDKASDTIKPFQSAVSASTAALGIDDITLSKYVEIMDQNIQESISNRKITHQSVNSAHEAFGMMLNSVNSQLESYETALKNVDGLSGFDKGGIISVLRRNRSVAFVMVQSVEDAQALSAVYGDNPGAFFAIDNNKINDSVSVLIVEELLKWTNKVSLNDSDSAEYLRKLNSFVDGAELQSVNHNEPILTRLSLLSQLMGAGIISLESNVYDSNLSEEIKHSILVTYEKELTISNNLTGLLNSMYSLEIGTRDTLNPSPTYAGYRESISNHYQNKMNITGLINNNFEFDVTEYHLRKVIKTHSDNPYYFKLEENNFNPTKTHYNSVMATTSSEVTSSHLKHRIEKIEQEKIKNWEDLAKAAGRTVSYMILEHFFPGISPWAELVDSTLIDKDPKLMGKGVNGIPKTVNFLKDGYSEIERHPVITGTMRLPALIYNLGETQKKISKLDREKIELTDLQKGIYTDKGDWQLRKKSEIITSSRYSQLDSGELLRLHELDTKGVLGFYHNGNLDETWEDSKKGLRDILKSRNISETMISYMVGESDSNLKSFTDFTNEDLEEFEYGLEGIKTDTGVSARVSFLQYLTDKFEVKAGVVK